MRGVAALRRQRQPGDRRRTAVLGDKSVSAGCGVHARRGDAPRTAHRADVPRAALSAAGGRSVRLLTMKRAKRRGERGGFISYRNLGIN
ncbi:hypothetical protein ABZ372_19200, partial [Streptomyces sp. NPDC005921]